jgi:integrase
LYDRLAGFGLVPRRVEPAERKGNALLPFIDEYVAKRVDVKPATKEIWRQGKMGLVKFFGANKSLDDVTAGAAMDYKLKLIADGLKPYTVSKRLQFANKIFMAAVDHELIEKNPFAKVKIKKTMEDRKRFITAADTAKLLDSCPDQDWRLIVALARWGGLRCLSEVLSIRWEDVDWQAGRIKIVSPKTAHHAGKDHRIAPLFPELRMELEQAWMPDASGYVVDEKHRKASNGPAGWRNCNLRTTFEKLIIRAGLTPWPRLFHNLRSSRQTELAETFPTHVVCAWLGNSEDIAKDHYLQVTDEHFERAQIRAQQATVQVGNAQQSTKVELDNCRAKPVLTQLYTRSSGSRGIRTIAGFLEGNAIGERPCRDFDPN